MNLSARQAWTLGVGGVLGVLFIAVGLAWNPPRAGECLARRFTPDPRDGVSEVCLDNAAQLSWVPLLLVLLGIVVIVVGVVGAFASSRRAGVLTLGGSLAFVLIGMGLAWDGYSRGGCMEWIDRPALGPNPLECVRFTGASTNSLPPVLLTAGIIVAIITVALALSPWGRGKA